MHEPFKSHAYHDGIELAEDKKREWLKLLNESAGAPAAGSTERWIPVSEKLPRELTTVLISVVAVEGGTWTNTGYFGKDKVWHEHELEGPVPRFGVTHWKPMPLPALARTDTDVAKEKQ